MTIRHLKIFVAVVESGSMSMAAKKLFITQSTVSQAIKELEKHYETPLFDRFGKKLYLTDMGEHLLSYARQAISMFDEVEEQMFDSSIRNQLRIGATITIGSSYIITIIRRLNKLHPRTQAKVDIFNASVIENKLLTSQLDIALVEGSVNNPNLMVLPAFEDRLVFICEKHHALADREVVRLEDLRGENFILREKGSSTRRQLEQAMQDAEIPYTVAWNCNAYNGILNAVVAGFGVSVLSEKLLESEWLDRLSISRLEGNNWGRMVNIVFHKNKHLTEAMKAFIQACRQQ